MAMSTTQTPAHPTQQAATPGVGASPGSVQGMRPAAPGVAQTPDTAPAKPVLFEDLDPVLLVRLYPDAKSGEEMRTLAMAAGDKAHEDGKNLVAAQQEPVAGA
jgi:hypothetical protein